MKILSQNKKIFYVLSCFLVSFFLFGCKEKSDIVSVFQELPDSNYLSEIKGSIESKKPVAIAFTAEWCPHCKQYKPVFFETKKDFEDKVTFLNIDVDDENGSVISGRFQVRGIPTTAFVRPDGSVFKVQVGEVNKEDLTKIIDDLLKSKKKRRGEAIAPFPIDLGIVKQPQKEEQKEEPQEIIKKEEEQIEKIPTEEIKDIQKEETPQDGEKINQENQKGSQEDTTGNEDTIKPVDENGTTNDSDQELNESP